MEISDNQPLHFGLIATVVAVYVGAFGLSAMMVPIPAEVVALSVLLACALIALTLIDFSKGILPDTLTLGLVAGGLFSAWLLGIDSVLWRLISAGLAGLLIVTINLIYSYLRGRDGIGYGDAKLLAASGAWLGLLAVPTVLLWACASGLALVLALAARGEKLNRSSALAFGPHIAIGTWLVWLFGAIG